jgi:hypothetical protein
MGMRTAFTDHGAPTELAPLTVSARQAIPATGDAVRGMVESLNQIHGGRSVGPLH